ncbi:MAG: threonine/serine dehydratase [Candidatus Limnocylindrales bacterium]
MTIRETYPDQVTLDDVRAAADCLTGVAVRTPLLAVGPFDDAIGAPRAWLKPENLQPIGAFKIRGAYNALATLSPADKARGVVTHSSGNHAQGVARAARMLGLRAVIVMPDDAPAIKVAGVRADGAEIEFVGSDNEARIARADELAAEQGLVLIPSFDDARIVAGQGTVGLEIVEQVAELGRANEPLTVFVPIGGGGLSSGVCVAVKSLRPDATVIGVEPELAADAAESLAADRIVRWGPELTGRTIADGVRTSAVGRIPFAQLRRLIDEVVTVSEDDIKRAMLEAATRARIVAEPSGALAIAGWMRYGEELPDADESDTVMIVSGGNVDPEVYRSLLAEAAALA